MQSANMPILTASVAPAQRKVGRRPANRRRRGVAIATTLAVSALTFAACKASNIDSARQPAIAVASTADSASGAPAASSPKSAVPTSAGIMPNVVGMDLQTAQDTIQAKTKLFFSDSRDATGKGRMQIVDRHWRVVGQTPAPGTELNEHDVPMLDVVKFTDNAG